jgi:3'(2'), 5'-bisphosphate nucleotidase
MFERELGAAREAGRRAGDALRRLYAEFQAIPDAPASISTEADRQSQEIILQHLRSCFPDDAMLAEEETGTLASAKHSGERLWIVDPIDGTRGFARKNGEFSVMIGFAACGRLTVGVVLEPAIDRETYATENGGCWLRDGKATEVRCRVSAVSILEQATVTQSRSGDPPRRSPRIEALRPVRVIETYSAGIKLALVARGEADLYVNSYEAFHDWDVAAGHLLVTEAGGRVTGLRGEELSYGLPGAKQKQGLLASNGWLHEAAVGAMRLLDRES